jgi:tetratricopeptide (TPR) repeat protein
VRFSPPEELPNEHLFYLTRGDAKAAAGDYAAAVKLYRLGLAIRKEVTLLSHMGQALEQLGLYSEAEAAYTEAVERNPREAAHFVSLINLLVSHSTKDNAVSVGQLLQRAESFGLKAQVLRRLKDSF